MVNTKMNKAAIAARAEMVIVVRPTRTLGLALRVSRKYGGPSRPPYDFQARPGSGGWGQCGRDGVELRREIRADGCDRGDDHDRDQSGDEAVLEGGDARFILGETEKEGFHGSDPWFVA